MHIVDLAQADLDLAALRDVHAIELLAADVDADALADALTQLRALRGLRSLRLYSRVRALPVALTELGGLQTLSIIDPVLPGLPAQLGQLGRLRDLRLELFHLASLPRSISGLRRLRTLYIDSHHLCGLPEGLRELQDLRALTLLLRRVIVPDWEHPAHFRARFEQDLGALFELLASLPDLTSLTIGEPPPDGWCPGPIFDRLPAEFAGLHALERLALIDLMGSIALPHGVVMPGLRQITTEWANLDATPEELAAMFPGARISRRADGPDSPASDET